MFVALPGLAAAFVVVLVERWIDRDPVTDRRLLAILLHLRHRCGGRSRGVALAVRRAGLAAIATRVARIVVPVGLAAVTLFTDVDLVTEAARIV